MAESSVIPVIPESKERVPLAGDIKIGQRGHPVTKKTLVDILGPIPDARQRCHKSVHAEEPFERAPSDFKYSTTSLCLPLLA